MLPVPAILPQARPKIGKSKLKRVFKWDFVVVQLARHETTKQLHIAKIPKFPVVLGKRIKSKKLTKTPARYIILLVKKNGGLFVLDKDRYKDRGICEVCRNMLK